MLYFVRRRRPYLAFLKKFRVFTFQLFAQYSPPNTTNLYPQQQPILIREQNTNLRKLLLSAIYPISFKHRQLSRQNLLCKEGMKHGKTPYSPVHAFGLGGTSYSNSYPPSLPLFPHILPDLPTPPLAFKNLVSSPATKRMTEMSTFPRVLNPEALLFPYPKVLTPPVRVFVPNISPKKLDNPFPYFSFRHFRFLNIGMRIFLHPVHISTI